jgi:hypothetical protein
MGTAASLRWRAPTTSPTRSSRVRPGRSSLTTCRHHEEGTAMRRSGRRPTAGEGDGEGAMGVRQRTSLVGAWLGAASVVSSAVLAACGASTGSSQPAPSSDTEKSTLCARMGGSCQEVRPENKTCNYLSGGSNGLEVRDPSLCDQTSSLHFCCVQSPGAPALTGYVHCGTVLCPPGATCSGGTDFTTCRLSDGGGI